MPKISLLPDATTLDGTELIPLVKSGVNVKAAIGVAQVLQAFGDLPTNHAVGAMGFVMDAAGGKVPAFWDGSDWRQAGGARGKVKPTGEGIWIFGGGLTTIPALGAQTLSTTGKMWMSKDGYSWTEFGTNTLFSTGIYDISYANGIFVVAGSHTNIAKIISIPVPNPATFDDYLLSGYTLPPQAYNELLPGNRGGQATAFNNDTGEFTVEVVLPDLSTFTVPIINPYSGAVIPDQDWPLVGAGSLDQRSVAGMGTRGPTEVRVSRSVITGSSGVRYQTDHIETRPYGGFSNWQGTYQVYYPIVDPETDDLTAAPNVAFNGLCFGNFKASAVEFLAGDT